MYGRTKSRKLFSNDLTEWFIESGLIKSKFQMSIYYKYIPYGTKLLFYLMFMIVYIGIYLKLFENVFLVTLWKRFHVKFLGFKHWFMSTRISQKKDNSISVYQARFTTYIVTKYLDTATVKTTAIFYKTTFPSDMIFTKDDVSTSDEQVDKLTK